MRESLHHLLKIQEIDKEITALHQSQVDYPLEIATLETELKTARDQLDAQQQNREELQKNRRALELDLGAIEADLKKHQDRLYEVKTNKEYDALQIEIATLQDRKDDCEIAILDRIEQIEEIAAQLGEDEKYYGEIKQDRQKRIDELTTQLNSLEENVRDWEEKRAVIEPVVDPKLLTLYNRIRKGVRDGVAVVPVHKGACGGCYRQLSPQRLVEVRRANSILRCDNCARILAWREDEGAA